ncbi:MAG: hypothetical protein AAFW84_26785 [Cyanobacteria bacterium J06635_15]
MNLQSASHSTHDQSTIAASVAPTATAYKDTTPLTVNSGATVSAKEPAKEPSQICPEPAADSTCKTSEAAYPWLYGYVLQELFKADLGSRRSVEGVAYRISVEVERVCQKSQRIQQSGQVEDWLKSLAQHRLQKCLDYYRLGSRQGRVELHGRLSAIAYRYIAPNHIPLGFQGRYTLLEDFLQSFYVESLKAFRRENPCEADYTPRTRLELAEYMAFSEHYAKRRIALPGCNNQQLLILRAQSFAKRQPTEAYVDIELAMESPRDEESDGYLRTAPMQQIREHMVAEAIDPVESVVRDRIVHTLMDYLRDQDQDDCVDYLSLRLQDLSASEIDEVLGLSPRQRDYLQQRFKYHVEKFAQVHQWELVHQWLGIDLERNLGLSPSQWQAFLADLPNDQCQLLQLKQQQLLDDEGQALSDQVIAQQLNCTVKQVQRRWGKIISAAWKFRNQAS